MEKICDLHAHSNCSDGSNSPVELVRIAHRDGISALALTDHNTTKGLFDFMHEGEESSVETVAGCEFSTQNEGKELHIVGLFLPEESWTEVEDYVELMHIAKHNSNLKLIDRLFQAGYKIYYDEVKALTDAPEFNRNHVARTLVKKGYANTIDEAFRKFLKKSGEFYTPAKKVSSLATIRFIKANGGVAVWAHPLLSVEAAEVRAFLPQAKKAGLDAIETIYTTYSKQERACAAELAAQNGLLCSGGSDYHGAGKPDINLGSGYGDLAVPYSFYEKLAERAGRSR